MSDKFIFLKTENRKALKEKFGVSDASVSDALNFRRGSIRARRIRSAAVNFFNGITFF